eukprot:CAMPEP_0177734236 /NCGR_PEP_ID=MMETSP0484_2-20121128/24120_1 /TAXON_ID=354590 /ORGANISM="Rhodomonas lens, Strain RHODO" /LENGTH=159 /DNA_ID=CAMNT_0019247689 /DNA_START=1 /DNA_END=477 /DNA_ORIENTATION=+
MEDEEEEGRVDPKDAAMDQVLREAREAMLLAGQDAPDLDFRQIASEVDAALAKLLASSASEHYIQSSLNLLIQVLTRIASEPSVGAYRRINASSNAFVSATGQLGTLCRLLLQGVGFEEERGSDTLLLPDTVPLFVVREAAGTLQLAVDRLNGKVYVGG